MRLLSSRLGTRVEAVNKRKKQLHAKQLSKVRSEDEEKVDVADHEIKLDPEVRKKD